MTDNTLQTVDSLDALEYIRVTSIAEFLTCPAKWRANILGISKKPVTTIPELPIATSIGTLVHDIIEQYLKNNFELDDSWWNNAVESLERMKVPPKERIALYRYIARLAERKKDIIAIEYEFDWKIIGGAPPVRGHIDAIFRDSNGRITIVDHKTNRSYQNVTWWKDQIQPLFYMAAASNFLSTLYPIRFEIGYVNLETTVNWEADGLEIERVDRIYTDVWEAIKFYRKTNEWPEHLNDYCNNCPVRDSCLTVQYAHTNFMTSFKGQQRTSLTEQYIWAAQVLKTIEAKVSELKDSLIFEIMAAGGKIAEGKYTFGLKTSRRRQIPYRDLQSQVGKVIQRLTDNGNISEANKLWDDWAIISNELISIKTGVLDVFIEKYPILRDEIEAITVFTESDKPTLIVKDKGKEDARDI